MADYVIIPDTNYIIDVNGAVVGGVALPNNTAATHYLFEFDSQFDAMLDPTFGPYFSPLNTNMLLDLAVYDLERPNGKALDGWWGLVVINSASFNMALLDDTLHTRLVFGWPGPQLLVNALDPSIGSMFEIIVTRFGAAYVGDWAQRFFNAQTAPTAVPGNAFIPRLDFSKPRDSQYIGGLGGM